jgi:hypothetical protein
MSKQSNGNRSPLAGLRLPEPPRELRRQVLDRAKQALGRVPRRDGWARLWESPRARLAWAASVLVLVVGHLVLPAGGDRSAREVASARVAVTGSVARSTTVPAEELAGIADLPRISLEGRPVTAAVRSRDESELDLDDAATADRSEENAS